MKNGHHYSIKTDYAYFLRMTIVDWGDLFIRVNHKMLIVDSLKYCCQNKVWTAEDADLYDFRRKLICE